MKFWKFGAGEPPANGHLWVWASLLFLWGWHLLLLAGWLKRDTRPLAWDQSVHMSSVWKYKNAVAGGSLGGLLHPPRAPGHPPYPPLTHCVMVPVVFLAEKMGLSVEDAARLANFFFLILLSLAAFALASDLWGDMAGVAAAFLASLAPPILEYSRELLVDLSLAAWVLAAYAAWVRSGRFVRAGWSLVLGLCVAGGLLTKWTFPLYVLPIVGDAVWQAIRHRREKVLLHVLAAVGIAALLAGPWYGVNLLTVLPRIGRAASLGGQEGDPSVGSLGAWLFYAGVMVRWLYGFGAVLAVGGFVWLSVSRPGSVWVLGSWLGTSYMAWSLVSNKDPRYILPALAPLPLAVAALPFKIGPSAAALALVFSGWFAWGRGSYSRPPAVQDWPLEAVVRQADALRREGTSDAPSVVTLVSNHEGLNGNNLRWTVEKLGLDDRLLVRGRVARMGEFSEFVLVKTGALGPPRTVSAQEAAREEVLNGGGWFPRYFAPAGQWRLPDDSQALLFHRLVPSSAPLVSLDPAAVLPRLVPGLEAPGLKAAAGSGAFLSGETDCRLRAPQVKVKALSLADVDLALRGLWAAADDAGQPRLLRLGAVEVDRARLTESAAGAFLASKKVKDGKIRFLEGNRLEISGRLHAPFRVLAQVDYASDVSGPRLNLKILSLKVLGLPLPAGWLGLGERTFDLKPRRGMPFFVRLSGLRTVPARDGAEGFLEVAP